MLRRLSWFLCSIICIVSLISCEESSDFKPGYAGSFGELIVVVDQPLWKSPTGDSIYNNLGRLQYGFPQDEQQFTLIEVASKKFKSVLKTHRNVCIVKIKSKTIKLNYFS